MDLTALCRLWLACFDSKDPDALVALYDESARHFSPKLRVSLAAMLGCTVANPSRSSFEQPQALVGSSASA